MSIPGSGDLQHMDSIWGSRFQTTARTTHSQNIHIGTNTTVQDILATVHGTLPEIPSNALKPDTSLGTGSMFHVRRELYSIDSQSFYVAVKHMRMEHKVETQLQIRRALLKELRAFTHPALRSHPHIISIFGYGWTAKNTGEPRPFLVLEYAEYGSLSELLQVTERQRHVSVLERYNLALDVACGLQVLHENGLIHGDLKTGNILICDRMNVLGYSTGPCENPWAAKIADFGSCITRFEADERIVRYTGTAIYNAPEIETDTVGWSSSRSFVQYKKADVYSFGLLLWEIMKIGRFYLDGLEDEDIAIKEKRYEEYLAKVYQNPNDPFLSLAIASLDNVRAELAEAGLVELWTSISTVFALCLKSSASQRGSAAFVYEKLQNGAMYELPTDRTSISDPRSGNRPPVVYSLPRLRSLPIPKPVTETLARHTLNISSISSGYWPLKHTEIALTENSPVTTFGMVAKDFSRETEGRVIPYYRKRMNHSILQGGSLNEPVSISLQRRILNPQPPREVQINMVKAWEQTVIDDQDTALVSEACMELSVCYLQGFGAEQDIHKSFNLLRKACQGSRVAKAIFARVSQAFRPNGVLSDDPRDNAVGVTYLSRRLVSVRSNVIITPEPMETTQLSMRPMIQRSPADIETLVLLIKRALENVPATSGPLNLEQLTELWETQESRGHDTLSQLDISSALTEACKMGLYDTAMALGSLCMQYIGKGDEPSPLHWLIKFPPEKAHTLLRLLVGDSEDKAKSLGYQLRALLTKDPQAGGPCHNYTNAQSTCGVYLPEHCMELAGTPLHWAVRARNLELVQMLLDFGADISARCKIRASVPGEPSRAVTAPYSALDLAIKYHMHEMVSELVERSRKSGHVLEMGASLLAQTTTPFARFVIHGGSYRLALQKTIQVLKDGGWGMQDLDHFDEIPISLALRNGVEERYIIEELVQATENMDDLCFPEERTLATTVAINSYGMYESGTWKLKQVLPMIKDLNALDANGYNALHCSALADNVSIARLLLSTGKMDLNTRSEPRAGKSRHSPLQLAAQFSCAELVQLLLDAGADPHLRDSAGYTALELATIIRKCDNASVLIEHGASINFRDDDNALPDSTVLHMACINGSGRPPITKQLLSAHEKLRARSVVNQPAGAYANTPLHQSLIFADLESAETLLQHGADPDYWWHPPDLDPLDPNTYMKYKRTPRNFLEDIWRRATTEGLDTRQLFVALHGCSESMRTLPHMAKSERIREREQWEYTATAPQFNFRLEDAQAEKQSQAGVKQFIARLEQMRRLMDEYTISRRPLES